MATRLQSTTRLLRWLTPGLEIKRWLLLLMFAELVLVLGFAYGLKALYKTAELPGQFYWITLQFLPYWLRALIFVTLGVFVLVFSYLIVPAVCGINLARRIGIRLLIGWIVGAVVVFAISLYFMGGGELGDTDSVGPSTFSRSAIGHAGIADVLTQLAIPVVKSRSSSLKKLSPGSVLVIAEPRRNGQSEDAIRTLLKADTILLVLPKWTGQPSDQKTGWLREVAERPLLDAQWALNLIAPRGEVVREKIAVQWTTNALHITPAPDLPVQLVKGDRLRPIVGAEQGRIANDFGHRCAGKIAGCGCMPLRRETRFFQPRNGRCLSTERRPQIAHGLLELGRERLCQDAVARHAEQLRLCGAQDRFGAGPDLLP